VIKRYKSSAGEIWGLCGKYPTLSEALWYAKQTEGHDILIGEQIDGKFYRYCELTRLLEVMT